MPPAHWLGQPRRGNHSARMSRGSQSPILVHLQFSRSSRSTKSASQEEARYVASRNTRRALAGTPHRRRRPRWMSAAVGRLLPAGSVPAPRPRYEDCGRTHAEDLPYVRPRRRNPCHPHAPGDRFPPGSLLEPDRTNGGPDLREESYSDPRGILLWLTPRSRVFRKASLRHRNG